MQSPCVLCGNEDHDQIMSGPDRLLGLPGEYAVMRCRVCGLARTEPQIQYDKRADYYAPEQDAEAGKADRILMYQSRTAIMIHRAAQRNDCGRLLDIGCGEGVLLDLMRAKGWEVAGVELGEESARIAREQRGLNVLTGGLFDLQAETNSFDAIVLSHVLEHLSDPMEQLNRVNELLRPGGLLLLSLPNYGSPEARLFKNNWYCWALPPHLFHFNLTAARKALAKVGLEVDRVTYLPFFFVVQNLRYCLAGRRRPSTTTSFDPSPRLDSGGKDKLKSVIFRIMLTVSDLLGRFLPGEIMEIQARKPK